MADLKTYIGYGLIGISLGWLFYKFTKPTEKKIVPPREEKEYILVKLPVPKAVGESILKEIVSRLKPSRAIPSFKPMGVRLEWDPIYIQTPLIPVGYTPPSKFITAVDVAEVKRKIEELEPTIVDKGVYWEVTLKIKI